jgi:hypothetical protein
MSTDQSPLETVTSLSLELSDSNSTLTAAILKCPPDYALSLHAGVRTGRTVALLRRAKRATDKRIKQPDRLIADLKEEILQHELTMRIVPPQHDPFH